MVRSNFDRQIAELHDELIEMGGLCRQSIDLVSKALSLGDVNLASRVCGIDERIDAQEADIESLCMKMLLQQQPVARDLRKITVALKMITDLARIGEQAVNIAEIAKYLGSRTADEHVHIREMAVATSSMVTNAVYAFVANDLELAKAAIVSDDEVDRLFVEVRAALIEEIASNPEDGEFILDLMMIAKYFERIGDHAGNVAEWVAFSITGEHLGEE